jgi:hypothetical protein
MWAATFDFWWIERSAAQYVKWRPRRKHRATERAIHLCHHGWVKTDAKEVRRGAWSPPPSTEEYQINQDRENQRGEGYEQVQLDAFDSPLRPKRGRRAVATPVVGNGEGVAAGHTRFERHLDQATAANATSLAASRKKLYTDELSLQASG